MVARVELLGLVRPRRESHPAASLHACVIERAALGALGEIALELGRSVGRPDLHPLALLSRDTPAEANGENNREAELQHRGSILARSARHPTILSRPGVNALGAPRGRRE